MFSLNKSTGAQHQHQQHRRHLRELIIPEHTAPPSTSDSSMDVYMYTGPPVIKPKTPKEKKPRARSSFFGGAMRRRATIASTEDVMDAQNMESIPPMPSTPITSSAPMLMLNSQKSFHEDIAPPRSSHSAISRLRKVSSRTNLSMSSSTATATPTEEKKPRRKTRALSDALKGASGSWQSQSSAQTVNPPLPISEPFDFTHLSHHDSQSVPRSHDGDVADISEEWNRALARESQIRPLRSQASLNSLHSRSNSIKSVGPRHRSGSTLSVSPIPPPQASPPAGMVEFGHEAHEMHEDGSNPHSPPLMMRSLSRHCVRIQEQPEEAGDGYAGEPLDGGVGVGHAVTTLGQSSYGRKSVGIEKLVLSPRLGDFESSAAPTAAVEDDKSESGCPGADEAEAARKEEEEREERAEGQDQLQVPERQAHRESFRLSQSGFLAVRSSRPLSQMSALSDTLNGHFTVPAAPITRRASVRSRHASMRFAHRRSASGRSILNSADGADAGGMHDSWEEDIDWIYSQEADADYDSAWDVVGGEEPAGMGLSLDTSTSASSSKVSHPLGPASPRSPSLLLQTSREAAEAAIATSNNTSSSNITTTTITVRPAPPTSPLSPPPRSPLRTSQPAELKRPQPQQLIIPSPPLKAEKRITGLFEDRLLLPLSPTQMAPPTIDDDDHLIPKRPVTSNSTIADEGEDVLIIKAAHTAIHARSPSISSASPGTASPLLATAGSFPSPVRSYREELSRVAQQLDEHIAALNNKDPYYCEPARMRSPSSASPVSPLSAVTPTTRARTGTFGVLSAMDSAPPPTAVSTMTTTTTTRARANSESTISTLVSDTDTVMPGADPTEAITPNSSAHNSFQLPSTSSPVVVGQTHYRLPPATSSGIISACSPPTHQQVLAKGRNMSVIGAGMGVEVRTEKGLSTGLLTFPAAAIPGVVEIAPEDGDGLERMGMLLGMGMGMGLGMGVTAGDGGVGGFVHYI